jgi:hypothetical protein
MVNRYVVLSHRLPEIAIAHPIAATQPYRPAHDLTLEVAPLEVRHARLPPSRRTATASRHAALRITPNELIIGGHMARQGLMVARIVTEGPNHGDRQLSGPPMVGSGLS